MRKMRTRPDYPQKSFRPVSGFAAALLITAVLFTGTARGAPGGELDATFGENGRVTISDASFGGAVSQQPDGKLLVAGYELTAADVPHFAVFRLHADGSLDDSFGEDGRVIIDFAAGSIATELAVQPDGKIVVAGESYAASFFEHAADLALARLDPGGKLDLTFGADGLVTLDLGGDSEMIRGLVILESGQLVVTAATDVNGDYDVAFARFNADGGLDQTFGTGSIAGTTLVNASTIADRANDEPFWITRQLDGKLVACGIGNTDYWDHIGTMLAVRVNADGSLDGGFGSNGVSLIEEDTYATTCVARPDGTIVLAGHRRGDLAFARLTSDGVKDTTFGPSGLSITDLGGWESVDAIIPLYEGGFGLTGAISAVGGNMSGTPTDMFVARADPDGTVLDPGFGNNGVTIVDFGHMQRSAYSQGKHLVQQADGKLVAVGTDYRYESARSAIVLVRIEPAGAGNAGFAGFAETSGSIAEGTELVVKVRRTGGSTGNLSADYTTVSDTAVAPGDFVASFGTLHWESGDIEPKSIIVPITNDGVFEEREAFTIALSNSTGGLAASEFLVVISNEREPPPPFQTPSGSGGGGGFGTDLLMLLAMARWLGRPLTTACHRSDCETHRKGATSRLYRRSHYVSSFQRSADIPMQ